jgi:hypothetical protein
VGNIEMGGNSVTAIMGDPKIDRQSTRSTPLVRKPVKKTAYCYILAPIA